MKMLAKSCFPQSQTQINRARNKILRCEGCHVCQTCQKPKDARSFVATSRICVDCASNVCHVCQRERRRSEFDEDVWVHHENHKRALVCLACADQGYSPKDTTGYECSGCGVRYGHLSFNPVSLCRHKGDAQQHLHCQVCLAKKNDIGLKLRQPGAWKCTCPRQEHMATNEKCNLFSPLQPRWPGGNRGVSRDDWLWFQEASKKRKRE